MVLARLTPPEWEVTILDENVKLLDYAALPRPDLRKEWIAQATINFADDEDLPALARAAGCCGVFIGFESPSAEGLGELGKKFNLQKGRDFRASVRRIQRHNIQVINLIANLSARNNSRAESQAFVGFQKQCRGYFGDASSDARSMIPTA